MRNANGYGSVIKLSGNRRKPWACRQTIGWKDHEEKGTSYPIYKYISYHATRKEAIQALAEYNKNPFIVNNYTIKDIYNMWLEWHPKMHVETEKKYSNAFKKLEPIQELKMYALTKEQLQKYFDDLSVSAPILKHIKLLLKQLIDFSVKRGYAPDSVMFILNKIDFVARKETKKVERKVFSKEEIDYLWKHKENKYCKILLVYIYTGMRYSELVNIKEEDIDKQNLCINIKKSKTISGVRTIPLTKKVISLMPLEPVKYNTLRLHLLELENIFGVRHTIHDTRHTFITLMTEAEVDERIIKQIVGHKDDDNVTESVYTHVSIDKMRAEMEKI